MTNVTYEWLVEILDLESADAAADADILEVSHADTYAEALRFAEQAEMPVRIGLVRDRGDNLEGLIDRQWAYLSDGTMGTLPKSFDGGARVPSRFHDELERN